MTRPPGRPRIIGARFLSRLLRASVSLGALAYLASVFDWAQLDRIVGRVRPGLVLAGPPLLVCSFAWAGLRWSLLLGRFGVPLRWRDGFLLYLIGSFYNILLPGMLGGDVVRVGLCATRLRKPVAEIATTALIERVLGLVAILLIGTAAAALLDDAVHRQLGPVIGLTIPALAAGAMAALSIGWASLRATPASWLDCVARRRPLRILARLAAHLRSLSTGTLLLTLLLSVLCQLPVFVSASLLGGALDIDLPLEVYCVVMPVVVISTMLPISLGGLGVREGVLTLLLARVGVRISEAIALSFLIYLVYAVTAVGGVLAQVAWRPATGAAEEKERDRPISQDAQTAAREHWATGRRKSDTVSGPKR
jgi:uncharacterized membrane protein YbhN (UPF0104 family)